MKTFPDSIPAPPHRRRPVWGICFLTGLPSQAHSHQLIQREPLAVTADFADCQSLSQSERLWHSVTFSGKRKSSFIENEPSLPRALLPGELAPQASERLDKGRLSSERRTQVLLCTTSPTSSLRSMPLSPFGTCVPPPPAGGVFPSRGGFGIP